MMDLLERPSHTAKPGARLRSRRAAGAVRAGGRLYSVRREPLTGQQPLGLTQAASVIVTMGVTSNGLIHRRQVLA